MSWVGFKIKLQSPTLLAATPPASNLTETLPFIPGNTVRGLLAKRYLDRNKGKAEQTFQKLFVLDKVKFGFACLDGSEFLPLSARTCKYYGGFKADDGHGVMDLLLAGNRPRSCDHSGCNLAIDYFKGCWNPVNYRKVSVKTRLITRTAIDPTRATARSGQLYSHNVLEEGQIFLGSIEMPRDLKKELVRLLKEPFTGLIGTGTSRGQGWVEVSQDSLDAREWESAQQRFERFPKQDGKALLAVTLLTDGLFQDDYLRDITAPTLPQLTPLGINTEDWEGTPVKAFMDTRLVFGFDGQPVNLPRQPRLAVAAGSVFLFKAKSDSPLIPKDDGVAWIGDGNGEGFGQAVLWHPFHLQADRDQEGVESEQAPLADLAEVSFENRLIRQARVLYQKGFTPPNISKAQMAAVNELILRQPDIELVQKSVEGFLTGQLEKLEKKMERSGKPTSWALPETGDKETLGSVLIQWIKNEKYLKEPLLDDSKRLDVMRRFWNRFYGFYRYQAQLGKGMPIVDSNAM